MPGHETIVVVMVWLSIFIAAWKGLIVEKNNKIIATLTVIYYISGCFTVFYIIF